MEAMVAAIEANDIHPVIDEKRFSMDQARDAFHFLVSLALSLDECFLTISYGLSGKPWEPWQSRH